MLGRSRVSASYEKRQIKKRQKSKVDGKGNRAPIGKLKAIRKSSRTTGPPALLTI